MGWLRLRMDGRRGYLKPRFSETHESPSPTLMRNRLEGDKLGVESSHSAGVLVLIEVSG